MTRGAARSGSTCGCHFLCSELRSRCLGALQAAGREGQARALHPSLKSWPVATCHSRRDVLGARGRRSPAGSARSSRCLVLGDSQTCPPAGAATQNLQVLSLVWSPGIWSEHGAALRSRAGGRHFVESCSSLELEHLSVPIAAAFGDHTGTSVIWYLH